MTLDELLGQGFLQGDDAMKKTFPDLPGWIFGDG